MWNREKRNQPTTGKPSGKTIDTNLQKKSGKRPRGARANAAKTEKSRETTDSTTITGTALRKPGPGTRHTGTAPFRGTNREIPAPTETMQEIGPKIGSGMIANGIGMIANGIRMPMPTQPGMDTDRRG